MKSSIPKAKRDLVKEQEVKNAEDTRSYLQSQIDVLKEDVEKLQKLCDKLIKEA